MNPIVVLRIYYYLILSLLLLLLSMTTSKAMSVKITNPTTVSSTTTTVSKPQLPLTKIPPPPAISMPVWSLACSTNALSSSLSSSSIEDSPSTTSNQQQQLLPSVSMNIVTFCTAVSVVTPKLYIISLYYHTLTKDAFLASGMGILQLLRPCQKHLVPILGKHSGYDNRNYNKRFECDAIGYPWVATSIDTNIINSNQQNEQVSDEQGDSPVVTSTLDLLPNCATYIRVKIVNHNSSSNNNNNNSSSSSSPTLMHAGDHVVVLCEVVETLQWDDTTQRIVPTTTVSSNDDNPSFIPSYDPTTVLYTGQLRNEGII